MKKPVSKKMGGGLMARPAGQAMMAQRAGAPMTRAQPAPRPMAMKKGGKTKGCKA